MAADRPRRATKATDYKDLDAEAENDISGAEDDAYEQNEDESEDDEERDDQGGAETDPELKKRSGPLPERKKRVEKRSKSARSVAASAPNTSDLSSNQPAAGHSSIGQPPANLQPVPSFQTRAEFDAFAQRIVNSMNGPNGQPPVILSFIYTPWDEPVYDTPIEPRANEDLTAFKSLHGNDAKKMDIPWLPATIPGNEPAWKFAVYHSLGASVQQIAYRIPTDDATWSRTRKAPTKAQATNPKENTATAGEQEERKLRKLIDDFNTKNGRIGRLKGSRPTFKGNAAAKVVEALHWNNSNQHMRNLRLYYNCAWDFDPAAGTMRQPGSDNLHPMFQHRYSKEFKVFLEEAFGTAAVDPNQYPDASTIEGDPLPASQEGSGNKKRKRKQKSKNQAENQPAIRPECNRQCPKCCHKSRTADEPSYSNDPVNRHPPVHLTDPQVVLHGGLYGNDDIVWEAQWTNNNQEAWNQIPTDEPSVGQWPMSMQRAIPIARIQRRPIASVPEQYAITTKIQVQETGQSAQIPADSIDPNLPSFQLNSST